MIWSASVERPCEAEPSTAAELLDLFGLELRLLEVKGVVVKAYVVEKPMEGGRGGGGEEGQGPEEEKEGAAKAPATRVSPDVESTPDISPSLIYATAAALEGCHFINGGSQNTVCAGLVELCAVNGGYALGTDFKAGQTKFKTAALEYVRALGLDPRVMASSNHLGNNDMKNLLAPALCKAKMRVKEDIFARWRKQGWASRLDHQVR